MTSVLVILGIAAFAFLIFTVYAIYKEKDITEIYQGFNVYGRFKAYIFANFMLASVLMAIGLLADIFFLHRLIMDDVLFFIVFTAVCSGITYFVYNSAKNKCPEGRLKEDLMKNMFISGAGVAGKIITFMIFFTAKILEPRTVIDEKGRVLRVFINGDVYDTFGNYVGKEVDGHSYVEKSSN